MVDVTNVVEDGSDSDGRDDDDNDNPGQGGGPATGGDVGAATVDNPTRAPDTGSNTAIDKGLSGTGNNDAPRPTPDDYDILVLRDASQYDAFEDTPYAELATDVRTQAQISGQYGDAPPARNQYTAPPADQGGDGTSSSSESDDGTESSDESAADNGDMQSVRDRTNRRRNIEQLETDPPEKSKMKWKKTKIALGLGFLVTAIAQPIFFCWIKPCYIDDPESEPKKTGPTGPQALDDTEVVTPSEERTISVNVIGNDISTNPNSEIKLDSVTLIDPKSDANTGKTIVVDGEGTWSASEKGIVTFTFLPAFSGSPSPVEYTIQDNAGNTSKPGKITLYLSSDDNLLHPRIYDQIISGPNEDGEIVLNVLNPASDMQGQAPETRTYALSDTPIYLAGRVRLLLEDLPKGTALIKDGGKTLEIPHEGTWRVSILTKPDGTKKETGEIEFTPAIGFTGNPTTAIRYQIADNEGNLSNEAIISVSEVYADIEHAIETLAAKKDSDFWTDLNKDITGSELTDVNFIIFALIRATKLAMAKDDLPKTAQYYPGGDDFAEILDDWMENAGSVDSLILISDFEIPPGLEDIPLGPRLVRLQLINGLITNFQSDAE